ncbi:MAG TPA: type II toxin-antitoxin system death-on-curing family toxin [Myxococcota bacterium]|nr:type II toxin-antitoxin system death-on-curing family toxin [Myxococcota bacterium]
MPSEPRFLKLDEVLAIHAQQIELYGGSPGLRDGGLLESALAMPAASFGGAYLHGTLHEMAAAYLFHLASNHPFVDGIKRVGLAAAGAFLGMNGMRLVASEDQVVDITLGVAAGTATKADVAVFLQEFTEPR